MCTVCETTVSSIHNYDSNMSSVLMVRFSQNHFMRRANVKIEQKKITYIFWEKWFFRYALLLIVEIVKKQAKFSVAY